VGNADWRDISERAGRAILDRDRHRKRTSKPVNFSWKSQLLVFIFRKRVWAGLPSSMFFDKISDFSASFSVQYSAQLFTTQDMTRTVSRFFQPTFKNSGTFCGDQNHRLKNDRDSFVTDWACSLK
jgi:hypothetical protein